MTFKRFQVEFKNMKRLGFQPAFGRLMSSSSSQVDGQDRTLSTHAMKHLDIFTPKRIFFSVIRWD